MYVPPRALLFVPAHRDRFREKALGIEVDALILDLEDAVPPNEKPIARDKAAAFIASVDRRTFVRINPIHASTAFTVACGEDDLATVVRPGLRGIVLPKVERAQDVREVDALLRAFERSHGMTRCSTELIGIVETAEGIQNLGGIVQAGIERPFCLAFGAGDFTGDLGIEWTSAETECAWARNAVVIASRAGRLPKPLDSVFADIRDIDGLKLNARTAKAMGFQGKLVIHPDQIAAIQDIFSPQSDEISWAERVLDGMKQAEEQGLGAFTVDNKLIDYPILERAKAIQARLGALG
jgi:citrate lyase beta subunit